MIQLFNSRTSIEPLLSEVAARQRAVLEGGRYILGPEVEAFESELSTYLGVAECVGVANGTDALTVVLRALGIGRGDEVVVPALTFYATAEAVVNAGADPVFCDVDPQTLCMTGDTASVAITERTAALLPVHLFGNPAPMDELTNLARRHGLALLEDAAQAAGARLDGRMAGSLGDAATFSFFPSKNLGGFGDGGAVITDDPALAARARRLRFHGSEDKVIHTEVGYNSRLDELQAAGLRVLLPHLEAWTAARRQVAHAYDQLGLGEVVDVQRETRGAAHCYHLYVTCTPQRDRLQEMLAEAGIGSRPYYTTPLHRQPALSAFAPAAPLPAAEQAAQQNLALPMGSALGEAEIAAVVSAVSDSLAR